MLEILIACAAVVAQSAHAIIDAEKYTQLQATTTNGKLYRVIAPDSAPLDVIHLYGSAYERGEAHGELLGIKLLDFVEIALPAFFKEYVGELADEIGKLPKWLQDTILKLLPYAEDEAPKIFDIALDYVELVQRKYNRAQGALYDEIDGIAQGACAAAAKVGRACDVSSFAAKIRRVNMLPDLLRMQCSMLGAWGGATPGGSLVQLRSLDFGGGPFANNTVLIVHHPTVTAGSAMSSAPPQPFAALSFPGFVGVVTGFSPSVALSEKVNDVANGPAPKGSYEGRSTSFVIRDMIERARTKEVAHAIALNATRTWTVWLGVGDVSSQRMLVIRYTRADAPAYDEATLPSLTGQPAIDDVVYVDKHPQPSTGDLTMPNTLQQLRKTPASIDQGAIAALGDATHSGDVHIAIYDYSPAKPQVLFALGSVDANGTFTGPGGRYAWAAPYLRFDQQALWMEARP